MMFQQESLYSTPGKANEEKSDVGKCGKTKDTGRLNVYLMQGNNLLAADRNGFSDPFCKCVLLPTKSAKTKRKSPVIEHTLNPVWDYRFDYKIDYEDLALHGIEISVWDWDLNSSNDFLGCCHLNLGAMEYGWDDGVGVEVECWRYIIEHPNTWKEFVVPLRTER